MTAADILDRLTTKSFGREIRVHASLASTNDAAKDMAARGAPEGTVVVAIEQTAGRGRQDRSWHSAPGLNLTFSLIVRPKIVAGSIGVVSLFAAAAVAGAVSSLSGKDAGCKWPNDVVVGGRKISGILCESTVTGTKVSSVVIGIGLNVNQRTFPPDIARAATSIAIETGRDTETAAALAAVLASLEPAYRPEDPAWPADVVAAWTARNVVLGSRIRAERGPSLVEGIARSVTPQGALRVETASGEVELTAGDVHIV